MWPFRRGVTVTCIACGTSLPRAEAREYDKFGDRWDRVGKSFEHLCKPCHRELSRTPAADLESLLVEAGAGECGEPEFLARYFAGVDCWETAIERRRRE
ncbi:DUF7562 family protein [Natronobiforma cellulositropha]|uniref:DUF7562 family protein n=1 Tax=Natronobiforma cellulositropha TaxID=1679076 RepID=UPI0021D60C64|nr:hypothetical protein [Natronobiforma cellulositropha]